MRRKKPELTIFSMSALDLFASALGAFILITLILIPYYMKEKPVEAPTDKVCEAPKTVICKACEVPPVITCPVKKEPVVSHILADSFMMLTVEWRGFVDVDTYIQTPDGWFGPQQKIIPGSGGVFVFDDNRASSKSLEFWKVTNAKPGVYTFCVNMYGANMSPLGIKYPMPPLQDIRVSAKLEKPSGVIRVNNIRMTTVIRDNDPFPARKSEMACFLSVRLGADMKARRL